jgi:cation diffusion facilitator family transporter
VGFHARWRSPEAGHSLIDLGATVMTYIAVRISGKPADEEHHYGHGKVEAVSALAETALLFLLSGIVIWEAVKRLVEHEGHVVEATVWAFGVIVVSIVVDFFRARALSHTAEKTSSHALEADALHFSSDLWSSLAVLVGLIGVHYGLAWQMLSLRSLWQSWFVLRAGASGNEPSTLSSTSPRQELQQKSQPLQRVCRE